MQITYHLEASDYWRYIDHVCARAKKGIQPVIFVASLVVGLGVPLLLKLATRATGDDLDLQWGSLFVGILIVTIPVIGGSVWSQRHMRRRLTPLADGPVLAERTLTLETDGIRTTSDDVSGWMAWRAVRSIEETADHLFIEFDRCEAHVIPKRVFNSPNDLRSFMNELKTLHANAQ